MRPTASQLSLLRSQPHRTNLWMSIYRPKTIMVTQVTGTYDVGDRTISYVGTITGSYLSTYADMTVLVGSQPGLDDAGRIRMRSITGTYANFAENSIDWESGQYLTMIDYITPEAIYPRIIQDPNNAENVIFYKDYDIAYSNQNSIYGTFICMGPHRAMFLFSGTASAYYTATGTNNVASQSLTYSWLFEGGTPTGSTSLTPGNVTYSTAGHYRTKLTVTAANGAVDESYRYVSVYDRPYAGTNTPILQWEMNSLAGSRSEGGYTTNIKIYEDVSNIEPNALVVIFADNWYGGTTESIGGNAVNASSIVFVGYILKDSIKFDAKKSYVEFDVGSISEIMKGAEGFAVSCESKASPSTWFELYEMTVPKAMYHYLRWHSTILKTTDFQYTGDSRLVQYFDADRGSLFDAVDAFMRDGMLGSVCSDRQGKLWAEIFSYGLEDPFTDIPTNFTFHKQDWMGTPSIEERRGSNMSFVELGGIAYYGVSTNGFSALLSNAPSTVPLYKGKSEAPHEGLILNDQRQLNQLAGHFLAHHNAPFPTIQLALTGNYSNLDIAPIEKTNVVVSRGDSIRRKSLEDLYYIVDSMEWNYDSKEETFLPEIQLTQIATGTAGQTVVIPPSPPEAGYGYPDFNLPPLPTFGSSTPASPYGVNGPTKVLLWLDGKGLVYTENFDAAQPDYYTVNAGLGTTIWGAVPYEWMHRFFVTPGGQVYVWKYGAFESFHYDNQFPSNLCFIYRAPAIGETFSPLLVPDTLGRPTGINRHGMFGASYSKILPDSIVAIVEDSLSGGASHILAAYRSSSGGAWSTGYRGLADSGGGAGWPVHLAYGDAKWLYVNGGTKYVLSTDASSLVNSSALTTDTLVFDPAYPAMVTAGGRSFHDASGLTSLMVGENNLSSNTVYNYSPDAFDFRGFACNPSGNLFMARHGTGVGKRGKSSDGGATVSGMPNLAVADYVWAWAGGNGITDSRWIAGAGSVYYSDDFGNSWTNKGSASLLAIDPTPSIVGIQVIEM